MQSKLMKMVSSIRSLIDSDNAFNDLFSHLELFDENEEQLIEQLEALPNIGR